MLYLIQSNRLERLFDRLCLTLGDSPTDPLKPVEIVVQNPGMTRLMFGGVITAAENDDNAQRPSSILEVLVGIIRAGQRVGAFRDRDLQELALVAWSSMHGLAMLVGDASLDVDPDDTVQLDTLVRSMTENVLYGISRS